MNFLKFITELFTPTTIGTLIKPVGDTSRPNSPERTDEEIKVMASNLNQNQEATTDSTTNIEGSAKLSGNKDTNNMS